MILLDGRCIFNSPASAAVPYFGRIGFPCPTYANPADFLFMHVLTNIGDAADASRTAALMSAWEVSDAHARLRAQLTDAPAASREHDLALPKRDARPSFGLQFATLFRRALNDVKRNKMRGAAQVGQSIVFALIVTLIWLQVDNDQDGAQDRAGALFFACANGLMNNVMGVLTTFGNERATVLREQENGMYTTLPYFLARVLVNLPVKILAPTVFSSIAYWGIGFRAQADSFGNFVLTLCLMAMCGDSIGLVIASFVPDVALALVVAPMIVCRARPSSRTVPAPFWSVGGRARPASLPPHPPLACAPATHIGTRPHSAASSRGWLARCMARAYAAARLIRPRRCCP